jgi:hypothetical protein
MSDALPGLDDAIASVLHQDNQSTAVNLRNNLANALPNNPDEAAAQQHLARAANVPVQTVQADPQAIRTQVGLNQVDANAIATQMPHVAKFLGVQANADIAHDDIPNLAQIEKTGTVAPTDTPNANSILDSVLNAPHELLKGLGGSFNKLGGGVGMLTGALPVLYDKLAGGTTASDWWFRTQVDPLLNRQQAFEPDKNAGFTEKAANTIGGTVGAIAQIILSGGAGEVAPIAGEVTAGAITKQAIEHGTKSMAVPATSDALDTGRKVFAETGDGMAAAKAAMTQYGVSTMGGVVPISMPGSLLTRLMGGAVSGAATGEASRQVLNTEMPDQMQQPFDWEQVALSGMVGMALTAGAGGHHETSAFQDSIRRTYSDMTKAGAAVENGERVQALGQLAMASKLRERDPQAFNQFVQGITENGPLEHVYIDAKTLDDALAQSGVPPEEFLARLPEVAKQMHEAVQTQGDVQIPVADYATHIAGGPLDAAITPHLKTDPEGKTIAEAQEFYQNQVETFKNEAEQIVNQKGQQDAFVQSANDVHDNILGQLNDANRYPPDVNQSYAAMMRDFYVTNAHREGKTPGELFAENPLKIGATSLAGGLEQPAYHGSPHDFNKFSSEHIGTGEGAQAYGHGLYFAENPGIAAGYHDRLTGNPQLLELKLGSMRIGRHNDFDYSRRAAENDRENIRASLAEDLLVEESDLRGAGANVQEHVLKVLDARIKTYKEEWPEGVKPAMELRKMLAQPGAVHAKWEKSTGGVYQVDIPDEHVANFLQWEKPLSEQPEGVQKALYRAAKTDAHLAEIVNPMEANATTGETVMRWLTTHNDAPHTTLNADQAFASKYLNDIGIKGVKYLDGGSRGDEKNQMHNLVVFDDSIIKLTHKDGKPVSQEERDAYFQKRDAAHAQETRGAFDPSTNTIALLKHADLSTFHHEAGHFFLETMAKLATNPEGSPGIKADMGKALKWFGVEGTPEQTPLERWNSMTLDEKRPYHEQFARGYESYLMEGKAPSLELQPLFSRFKAWMERIYKSFSDLNVKLDPEIRGVYDRLLASDAQIKEAQQARGMFPLFDTKPDTMTGAEWENYLNLNKEATQDAMSDLQAKSLKDMRWLSNAKSKAMKELQSKANSLRRVARIDARREILSDPGYQAQAFLTRRMSADDKLPAEPKSDPNQIDERRDSLFAAIAKLGGLKKEQAGSEWGIKDKAASGVFGKPVLRAKGGLSIDSMAEELANRGYLSVDEHGKYDLHEFEEKFGNELRGHTEYSDAHDGVESRPGEGVNTDALAAGRFDRNALGEALGHGDNATYETLDRQGMVADRGLHPDLIGDMFGFESGKELADKLAGLEPAKSAIEGKTDQLMLERHGELSSPKDIERAAEAAIHNEARARILATELKALAKATGPASMISKAAKDAADTAIAQKRIRELRPAQYAAAETKNAKLADKALAKGDTAEAAQAKRAQLLNNRLAKAAQDAMEEVRKGLDYLKKFDKASVRENIELDYRDQIDALLDRYDLRKSTTLTALNKRESLLNFVERMASEGYEPGVPENLLNEAARMHYKDMPVGDFRGLLDAIKSVEHLGRLKQRLLDGQEMRELSALADEAKQTMATLPQRAAETNRGLTRIGAAWIKTKSWGRSGQAALLKMEQMMDWLDARNSNGVFNRVVFRRIADAGVRENEMLATVKAGYDDLMAKHLDDVVKDGDKIYTAHGLIDQMTGEAQRFTKKEMLSLAGNVGNDSNLAKLVAGEKWNEQAVWDFLHSNMRKADWDFVEGVGKTLETLWPEKLAMSRRLGNTNPEKIAPRPFMTPDGERPGWYWPVIYDPARSQDVAERGAKSADALFENSYTRANTDTGRMNTRNANYARPLLLNIDTIPRMIRDEVHDIAYREAILDADKFLSQSTVRKGIINALSQEHYDQLRPWLQSIANDGHLDDSSMRALKFFNSVAHGARTRATIVGLGYRISTMLVHGSSAGLESVAELGPKWLGAGIKDFANPSQWSANRDFIFERSGEMRNRMNEVDRDIREHLREIDLRLMDPATGAVQRGADVLKAHAYQGIAMLDMASALPTWMGAYHKAMAPEEQGGKGLSEADAIYFADKTVRNAHGGQGAKDMAAIQRGPEFLKLFTMFYTFWNHNVNRIMDTYRMAHELPATYQAGDMAKFKGDLGSVIMRTLVYTFGVQIMHGMLHPPQQGDDKEGWAKWAGKELASSAFAGIPIFRDLSAHFIDGKSYDVTPAASMVHAIGQSGQDAMLAATGKSPSDKWLKHTLTTTGYVFGLPLGQPASTGQFLWDVAADKQRPHDAADWWRGILHGEMKKH